MSETKHTPGPWSYSGKNENVSGHKLYVGDVHPPETENYRGPVCMIQTTDHLSHGQGITKEEGLANIKLIAAAPELLEALIGLKKWVADTHVAAEAINRATNAIKKATT